MSCPFLPLLSFPCPICSYSLQGLLPSVLSSVRWQSLPDLCLGSLSSLGSTRLVDLAAKFRHCLPQIVLCPLLAPMAVAFSAAHFYSCYFLFQEWHWFVPYFVLLPYLVSWFLFSIYPQPARSWVTPFSSVYPCSVFMFWAITPCWFKCVKSPLLDSSSWKSYLSFEDPFKCCLYQAAFSYCLSLRDHLFLLRTSAAWVCNCCSGHLT